MIERTPIFCIFLALFFVFFSCKNKDIAYRNESKLKQIHDSFNNVEFSKIKVDGIEYLMLERDNNNPHEGFGFMAFKANALMNKQDSIIAHLKGISTMQARIYAFLKDMKEEEVSKIQRELFKINHNSQLKNVKEDNKGFIQKKMQ